MYMLSRIITAIFWVGWLKNNLKHKGEIMLNKIIVFAQGKKTYLVALVAAVLNLLVACGVVSVDNLGEINAVLAALGGASLRAGVSKQDVPQIDQPSKQE